ncbi:MAG: hypothetical protein EPN47_17735 [Acidobacteria bacterium]|nr:MAG: hypothetical protein EPN47_17735 [Acidobacteriota bacterium]
MHDETETSSRNQEHSPLEKDLVTVVFKKEEFKIPEDCYTTEQLIAKFPIEPGYLLNLKVDGELVTLKPGQETCVKNGMHFYSQVPGGGSS